MLVCVPQWHNQECLFHLLTSNIILNIFCFQVGKHKSIILTCISSMANNIHLVLDSYFSSSACGLLLSLLSLFCVAQSVGCWSCFLPWLGARLQSLPGSFPHPSPNEFWSFRGCHPDQCWWENPFVPAQILPAVCTTPSHPENNVRLRWVLAEEGNLQSSIQVKASS